MIHFGPVCHQYGIKGSGYIDKGVAIVGIAPGQAEMQTGLVFTGMVGRLTDAMLKAVNWHREWSYCTNLCCWRPKDGKSDREPTNMEIAECIDRLEEELTIIKPKVIIALGAVAAEVLSGYPLGKARGQVIWKDDHYVIPTYHPAAILHGGYYLANDILRDFAKINDVVGWQPGGAKSYELVIITSIEHGQLVLDGLPRNIPISIDVETSKKTDDGLDIFTDRLLCFSISDGSTSWWYRPEFVTELDFPMDVQWSTHNGPFDVPVIARATDGRVWLPIVEDSMMQSYALDERGGKHKLKALVGEYEGDPFYDDDIKRDKKKMEVVDETKMQVYNTKDSVYTQRLVVRQADKQRTDNVRGFYEDILIPAANMFARTSYRGVHINRDVLNQLKSEWMPRLMVEQRALVNMASDFGFPGEINLASPKQVGKLLFEILGLEPPKRTKTGAPSTDKEVIALLDHPFTDALSSVRTLDHMLNTYIFGIEDDIKYDDRVHSSPLIHGTVTGRPSYVNPPVQTIPKDNKMGPDFGRVRNLFDATNDNYIIVEADYSQAEVWTGAYYGNDSNMFADLHSGDYHGRVTTTVFHLEKAITDALTWKYYRDEAKKITFGVMYGSEAEGLSHNMRCSVQEARDFLKVFYERYYGYKAYLERTHKAAIEEGEIVTITGRKRRFPLLFGPEALGALRQAVNFSVQSTSSDALLTSAIELHHILAEYDSHVLFTVHDSILFEVNQKHLHTVLAIIKEVMTKPRFPEFGFPSIPIDMKWGNSWGEAFITEE